MQRTRQEQRFLALIIISVVVIIYIFYLNTSEKKPVQVDVIQQTVNASLQNFAIQNPLILFYTQVFDNDPIANKYMDECPLNCSITTDKTMLEKADAVVFHAGNFGSRNIPKFKARSSQKFVFWTMETQNSGFVRKKQDGIDALQPDWIMDYSSSADVIHHYGAFYVDPKTAKAKGYPPIANFTTEQILKDKQFRGAVGFISNCDSEERLAAAKAMSKYMRIDIGGQCAFDKSKKDLCPRNTDCTPIINWNYFYLAFENMNCIDYVTEKFINILTLPVIPIVVSKKNYLNRFPKEAYIAMDDYKSAKELTDYLNHLMKHPNEYVKLFEWRRQWGVAPWNGEGYRNGVCALCEKLMKEGNRPTNPIPNIISWREEHAPCVDNVLPDSWFS